MVALGNAGAETALAAPPPRKIALPPLGPNPAGNAATSLQDVALKRPLDNATEATTRRLRELLHPHYESKDEELPEYVRKISSMDRIEAKKALARVWQMTLTTRANHAANQAALVELGGVTLAVDYAVGKLFGTVTSEDEDEAVMALLLLENLSCNVQLHRDMGGNPSLLRFLVAVIRDCDSTALRINAAKVLVNLTFSSPHLQLLVAEAGALPQALRLLHAVGEAGLVRQGAWLLSHLTAGQGCSARGELAVQAGALERMKDLLLQSNDDVTKIRVCEVVCNLARGDRGPHADLVRTGMVPALLTLIDPRVEARQDPEVVAPALLALAALAVGGAATSRTLLCEPKVATYLAGILDYSNLVTRNYDLSRVMVAAHTLIFALGVFAVRNKLLAPSGNVASGGEEDGGSDSRPWPPHVEQVVQESGYVSFPGSLKALGLTQPRYHPASLGKELGGPNSFVANTSYQVNMELIPLLKHDNARMVINACARLYQIAVCVAENAEGRAVLTNASLAVAVTDLLACSHSGILHAALSLVDALAALPEVVPQLVARGVMDSTSNIMDTYQASDHPPTPPPPGSVSSSAGEATDAVAAASPSASAAAPCEGRAEGSGGDPLVGLLAERALVTMFLAQESRELAVVRAS